MACLSQVSHDPPYLPGNAFLPVFFPVCVRAITREFSTSCLRTAVWQRKLQYLQDLFGGGTSDADERKALAMFRYAETADEMIFLVNNLSWAEIDDELDGDAVTDVAKHFLRLLNVKEHVVAALLRRVFPFKPEDLGGLPAGTTANIVNSFALADKQALANELLGMRGRLLDSVAVVALRGHQGYVAHLEVVFDSLIGAVPSPRLSELRWEVHYTSDICTRVERGEVGPLASALITLVDPWVPAP